MWCVMWGNLFGDSQSNWQATAKDSVRALTIQPWVIVFPPTHLLASASILFAWIHQEVRRLRLQCPFQTSFVSCLYNYNKFKYMYMYFFSLRDFYFKFLYCNNSHNVTSYFLKFHLLDMRDALTLVNIDVLKTAHSSLEWLIRLMWGPRNPCPPHQQLGEMLLTSSHRERGSLTRQK